MEAVTKIIEGAARAKQSLVTFFYRNACLRAGVPIDGGEQSGPIAVEHQHTHQHEGLEIKGVPSEIAIKQSEPSELSDLSSSEESFDSGKQKSRMQKVLPWLLAGAIPASALAGWGASALTFSKPEQVVVDRMNYEGSLLQYIEDQGKHLPGE